MWPGDAGIAANPGPAEGGLAAASRGGHIGVIYGRLSVLVVRWSVRSNVQLRASFHGGAELAGGQDRRMA